MGCAGSKESRRVRPQGIHVTPAGAAPSPASREVNDRSSTPPHASAVSGAVATIRSPASVGKRCPSAPRPRVERHRTLGGVELRNVGPTVAGGTPVALEGARLWRLDFEPRQQVAADASFEGRDGAVHRSACPTAFYYNDTFDQIATVRSSFPPGVELEVPPYVTAAAGLDQECTLEVGPGETKRHAACKAGPPAKVAVSLGPVTPQYVAALKQRADAYIVAQRQDLVDAEAAARRPWKQPPTAGRLSSVRTMQEADKADAAVAELALERGVFFVDRRFAPGADSLGVDATNPLGVLAWRRPADVAPPWLKDRVCAIGTTPDPGDINQGRLGDCYFCCAMSAVAEFPEIVAARFPQHGALQACGAHRVRLCDGGWWRDVVVDDFMPTAGQLPAFARNDTQPYEQWVSLLEKAWAKLHGSYRAIADGNPRAALSALTGGPVVDFGARWAEAAASPTRYAVLSLMADLHRWLAAGAVIAMSTPDGAQAACLPPRHTFAVLRVVEAAPALLLQLRDPWGEKARWAGDWAPGSTLWQRHPEVASACGVRPDGTSDSPGIFWMPVGEALGRFTSGVVCHQRAAWVDRRARVPAFAGARGAVAVEVRVGTGGAAHIDAQLALQQGPAASDDAAASLLSMAHFQVDGRGNASRVAVAGEDPSTPEAQALKLPAAALGLQTRLSAGTTHLFAIACTGDRDAVLSLQTSGAGAYVPKDRLTGGGPGALPFTVRFIEAPAGLAPYLHTARVDLPAARDVPLDWQVAATGGALEQGNGPRFLC